MSIPVFREIERLINEHGSAAILKERLALAADQYAVLEKQKIQLQLENENLKNENSKLRNQIEPA